MPQFNSVDVDTAANVYFDGGVISRSVHFADGSHKTLGIALLGEYKVTTVVEELMDFLLARSRCYCPGNSRGK